MKNLKLIPLAITILTLSFNASAFEDAVRKQVVKSDSFNEFKRMRMKELWGSKTDNPYIQCLRDEHARIPSPSPSFSDYHSVRHPIYISYEALYTINKAEACVEYEYESTKCELNRQLGYICDGKVYERNGFGETEPTPESAINQENSIKDALQNILIEDAIKESLEK